MARGAWRSFLQPWMTYLVVCLAATSWFLVAGSKAQSFIYDGIAISCAAVILVAHRSRRTPSARRSWLAIGLGILAWAVADIVWHGYEIWGDGPPPFPGPMDFLYLFGYPLIGLGIVGLSIQQGRRGADAATLDSAIAAVGFGALFWVYLGAPYLDVAHASTMELVTALAYPAGDALLVGAIARYVFAGCGRGVSGGLLVASMLVLLGADAVYLQRSLSDAYVPGGILDTGWLLSYAALGAAALRPDPEPVERVGEMLSLRRLLFSMSLPMLGPLLLSAQLIAGVRVSRVVIGVAVAALFVLAGFRVSAIVRTFNRHAAELRDRTESLTAALRELEANAEALRLQSRVLEEVESFVVAVDLNGRFTYWNAFAEQLFGWPRSRSVGATWDDVFGDLDDKVVAELVDALSAQGSWQGDLPLTQNGRSLTLRAVVSHLHDDDGQVIGTICIGSDVTAGRELEERLRRVDKLKAFGQLAGGIAHDFNNLLAVVINYASFLLDDLEEDDPRREDAEQIMRAGERGAALTRQLLAFSRKHESRPQTLLLNDLVRDMSPMLSRTIPENVVFRLELDAGLWHTRIDPGQMEQIVMNLVVNARDAMPNGGSMTLRTSNAILEAVDAQPLTLEPGRYVIFTVKDSGHGMDPETLARIFEPFFTTKEVGQGTGLGLATVYGIVRHAGGSIDVTSSPGAGATFDVYLPFVATPDLLVEAVEHGTGPSAAGEGIRVLVAEDEDAVRALVQRMLERNGYQVTVYASPEEAAKDWAAGQITADVLISDVIMPGLSGPELSLRIGLPTLLMSGYAELGSLEGVRLPSISKPFKEDELLAALEDVLAGT